MTPTLSTPALVLHTTQYAETSVIAKIFTRQLGVRSYILKGVRKGSSRTKQNLLQPLSYLDLVVYNNPKTSLNYLKEIAPHPAAAAMPDSLAQEAMRNAIRFFMTELLYKSLREEEPMPDLFDYVVESLSFDQGQLAHQPIQFLLTVADHLGISPQDNHSAREPYFDMAEGRFCSAGQTLLDSSTSTLLHYYIQAIHHGTPFPLSTLQQRTTLINRLLEYFQLHVTDFHSFKSHEILHSVLQ
ncbi:MAG: DNA repair protein RecO [Bacteroidales bacterium]|nr:DNA repair protein RecO [Bacteroidales bacterium]